MPHELEWLLAQRHAPIAVAQAQSTILAAADLHPMDRHRLDAMITSYTFEFGACNRIYNTAVPAGDPSGRQLHVQLARAHAAHALHHSCLFCCLRCVHHRCAAAFTRCACLWGLHAAVLGRAGACRQARTVCLTQLLPLCGVPGTQLAS